MVEHLLHRQRRQRLLSQASPTLRRKDQGHHSSLPSQASAHQSLAVCSHSGQLAAFSEKPTRRIQRLWRKMFSGRWGLAERKLSCVCQFLIST